MAVFLLKRIDESEFLKNPGWHFHRIQRVTGTFSLHHDSGCTAGLPIYYDLHIAGNIPVNRLLPEQYVPLMHRMDTLRYKKGRGKRIVKKPVLLKSHPL